MKKHSAIALMIILSVSLLAGCRKTQTVLPSTTVEPTVTHPATEFTTAPTLEPTVPATDEFEDGAGVPDTGETELLPDIGITEGHTSEPKNR